MQISHQGNAHGGAKSTDRTDSATSRTWVYHVLEVTGLFVQISLFLTRSAENCFLRAT